MKTTLPAKSKLHKEMINKITDAIVKIAKDKIVAVILFGSFARGNWVSDSYLEDGIIYKYSSDYDFLIVTRTNRSASLRNARKLKDKIDLEFDKNKLKEKHQITLVIESLEKINIELENNRYFFSDIKKEGILLYSNNEFKFARSRKLSECEKGIIAMENYIHWFGSGINFLKNTEFSLKENILNQSAFLLHQATESFYHCAILTITGYKHKTHDLEELEKLSSSHSPKFLTIFPKNNSSQKIKNLKAKGYTLEKNQIENIDKGNNKADWYELLRVAYIEARYNKNYRINKEQLEYLISRVLMLKKLVREICKNNLMNK